LIDRLVEAHRQVIALPNREMEAVINGNFDSEAHRETELVEWRNVAVQRKQEIRDHIAMHGC
jgi:hypothetical protein